MDPNSLPSPAPPQTSGQFDASQFDFIMNPNQQQKKSLIPGGPKQRMIIFIAGIAVVVVLLIVVILSIFSGDNSKTDELVKITQQQNEIIRIATDGNRKAGSEKAKKLATVTSLTVTTDQKNMLDYLAKQKRKVKAKELGLLVDKKTDAQLSAADSNGRYDDVFIQVMKQELTDYQTALKNANGNVGTKGKEVIGKAYANVTLILEDNKTP